MQARIFKNYKILVLSMMMLTVISCSNDDDLSDLNDTIFVRHKNADMPAYIHGNASEKVFLITLHGGPGGLGLDLRVDAFKNRIEKEYAVVYFDQRGSGMSQGSFSENELNIDIMAEDVLALVKVLKHKYGNDARFFLMGHSWGGALGTLTLLKDQDDFLGWIEVDGAHNPKGMYPEYIANFNRVANEQIELENNITYWESIINLVNSVPPTYREKYFFDLNNEAFRAERRLVDNNIINEQINGNNTFFEYNLITALWNNRNIIGIITNQGFWENVSYTDRLQEIEVPSLVLWGKYDMILPATFAKEAYDNLGSAEKKLVIFERSGHAPMLSEADAFVDEILLFMDTYK
ncbi:alpha/beta hydrolase [Aquimarina sp. D1M17]|uniref:alpha/beta fold hydrolase n=1 Tax=Aquimarina acroporae TaxID=2937283 RepID=UPI0020C027E6|nr:alpha/beta hydrolase [Aquimarina acroporae]MCK8520099.1 alpha/beta hydrolase [Aquimarina acroporae]